MHSQSAALIGILKSYMNNDESFAISIDGVSESVINEIMHARFRFWILHIDTEHKLLICNYEFNFELNPKILDDFDQKSSIEES